MDRSTQSMDTTASARRWLVLLFVGMLLALGGYLLARQFTNESNAAPGDNAKYVAPKYFQQWGNVAPELVLVVSGQAHNYLQPCGCSSPQFGGLVRRYNFIESLRDKGWKVLPIEVGDLGPKTDHTAVQHKLIMPSEQTFLKYTTMLQALQAMGYKTYGLGEHDFRLLDLPTLGRLSNIPGLPTPLCLTIDDAGGNYAALRVKAAEVLAVAGRTQKFSIGITSALGLAEQQQFKNDPNLKFKENALEIPSFLKKSRDAKLDLNILVYHGPEKDAKAAAEWCMQLQARNVVPVNQGGKIVEQNAATAPVDIMLAADPQFDEPPALPTIATTTVEKNKQTPPIKLSTPIYMVGHKGKYVGVIGLFKQKDGSYEQKYELVKIGPEFDTPPDKEPMHPIMKLMEDYTVAVAKKQLINAFSRTSHPSAVKAKNMMIGGNPVNVYFAGSERCADCHDKAHEKWSKSPKKDYGHHVAFKTLEDVKKPGNRHFDGECIVCHTVGFDYKGGYLDTVGLAPAKAEKHNEKLKNVGCESCHGPAGMHADNPNATELYELINPYRPSKEELDIKVPLPRREQLWKERMRKIDINNCQKCHDIENDVHWGEVPDFTDHWFKIVHNKERPGIQDKFGRPIAGPGGVVAPNNKQPAPLPGKLPNGSASTPSVSPVAP